ncbi:uncharacterized protein LOC119686365 [Teleopsis dalmanni]|uniref:uncharacterized protein LOC119678962 n=1 Tax=Teleopsis dalmanni TaxID=139649 RepID=UPI0018CE3BE4|nr:uncharacterized protein LOC119678962 [Teleopsis dalmanni]XP_037956867.1 uncharacterized protein LOC119686365 [Teleopsis dalmanni]
MSEFTKVNIIPLLNAYGAPALLDELYHYALLNSPGFNRRKRKYLRYGLRHALKEGVKANYLIKNDKYYDIPDIINQTDPLSLDLKKAVDISETVATNFRKKVKKKKKDEPTTSGGSMATASSNPKGNDPKVRYTYYVCAQCGKVKRDRCRTEN